MLTNDYFVIDCKSDIFLLNCALSVSADNNGLYSRSGKLYHSFPWYNFPELEK